MNRREFTTSTAKGLLGFLIAPALAQIPAPPDDDTARLQALIDAPVPLPIPRGHYIIRRALYVRNGATIQGSCFRIKNGGGIHLVAKEEWLFTHNYIFVEPNSIKGGSAMTVIY